MGRSGTSGRLRGWRRVAAAISLTVAVGAAGLSYAQEAGPLGHDAAVQRILALVDGAQPDATAQAAAGVVERAVPRARCGPGSAPETGLQGEVPQADMDSGRADSPYTCNLVQVNQDLGEGAGLQAAYYENCAYYGKAGTGVRVVDVTDRRHPKITATLTSPAMQDPWESLKVHVGRGLLGAVQGTVAGPLFFDVYDVKTDCTRPKLLASLPVNTIGHEGEWSQDGMTYYASAFVPAIVTAIDVSTPTAPTLITSFLTAESAAFSHGMSTNKDGTRLYIVDPAADANAKQPGLLIYDVSGIQAREIGTQPRLVSSLHWPDGKTMQHTIPVLYGGRPYVYAVDELGYGAVRAIDISDETEPRQVVTLRTEIQLVQNRARADATGGGGPQDFAYNTHYCNVDRLVDPTVLACSNRLSGVRVFDIRNVQEPREIAYWNNGKGMVAQVRLDAARGELWTTTGGTEGLLVARFTNGSWPFSRQQEVAAPPVQPPTPPRTPPGPGTGASLEGPGTSAGALPSTGLPGAPQAAALVWLLLLSVLGVRRWPPAVSRPAEVAVGDRQI